MKIPDMRVPIAERFKILERRVKELELLTHDMEHGIADLLRMNRDKNENR